MFVQRGEAQADTLSGGKICGFPMNKAAAITSVTSQREGCEFKSCFFLSMWPCDKLAQSEAVLAVIGHLTPTFFPLGQEKLG